MFTNNGKAIILGVVAFLVVMVTTVTVYAFFVKGPKILQPVEFNHKKHTQDNNMECVNCHKYVEKDWDATLPNIETCSLCHNEDELPADPVSKEKVLKLVAYIKEGKQIPWQRLFQLPSHVYFSHRTHVAFGKVKCEECHGDMGSHTSPPPHPLKVLKMSDCLRCHLEKNVTTDCLVCHR